MFSAMLYKILPTDKNKLWWPKLVGQTLSVEQFSKMLFNCFADIEIVYSLELKN